MTDKQLLREVKKVVERKLVNDKKNKKGFFIALMILRSKLIIDNTCSTAYAKIDRDGKPIIAVNYKFFKAMPYKFALLTHELMHLVHSHFGRFDFPRNKNLANILNVALDLAINQIIKEFAENNSIMIDDKPIKHVNYHNICEKYPGIKIEENQSAEYYYSLLIQAEKDKQDNQDEQGENSDSQDGQGSQDDSQDGQPSDSQDGQDSQPSDVYDHSKHFEENEDSENVPSKELASDLFQDMVRQCMSQSGVTPSEIGLDDIGNRINWKAYVKRFMQQAVSLLPKLKKNRKNRRFGWRAAKRAHERKAEINVLVDSTGSMSSYLPTILEEIVSMAVNFKLTFGLYAVDTELHYIGDIKKPSDIKNLTMPAGGCTDFSRALIDLEKDTKGKSLIFITDTYGNFPDKKPKYPVMLLTTEKEITSYVPDYFKRSTVHIDQIFEQA